MNYKKQFEDYLKKNYDETDFKVGEIKEDDENVYCIISSSEEFDIPLLVANKQSGDIKEFIIPPSIDASKLKTIYKSIDRFDETEDSDYDI